MVLSLKLENTGGYPSDDIHQNRSNDIGVGAKADVWDMFVLTPGKADFDVDNSAKSIPYQSLVYSLMCWGYSTAFAVYELIDFGA